MTEAQILKQCRALLNDCEKANLLQYIRNNTGATKISSSRSQRWVAFGKKGSADLIVAAKGRILFAEVKAPGRYLRPEQREFSEKCAVCENPYVVIHSAKELQEAIRKHLEIDTATELLFRPLIPNAV